MVLVAVEMAVWCMRPVDPVPTASRISAGISCVLALRHECLPRTRGGVYAAFETRPSSLQRPSEGALVVIRGCHGSPSIVGGSCHPPFLGACTAFAASIAWPFISWSYLKDMRLSCDSARRLWGERARGASASRGRGHLGSGSVPRHRIAAAGLQT